LNAIVDGELSPQQSASANEHLRACPACTASALSQSLLKSAVAKAGDRYAVPDRLRERILQQTRAAAVAPTFAPSSAAPARTSRYGLAGWAVAAAVLLVAVASLVLQQRRFSSAEVAALAGQVSDQHITTLTANSPLQVLSTDRHTVKPWFQGKLPFSFNIPENLPAGTRLEGANLAYIQGQAAAQLVYSIGSHRVSLFVLGRQSTARQAPVEAEHFGFHVETVRENGFEIVAVSDVEPAKLAELVHRFIAAQA
jgi:anti-sigma factor RsiW